MKTLTKATIVTAATATVLTGGYFYMQPTSSNSDTTVTSDTTPLATPTDTPSSTTVTTTPTPDATQVSDSPQVPATAPGVDQVQPTPDATPSPTPNAPISGGFTPNSGQSYPENQ